MRLSKIHIKNYRLLVDTELEADEETTLIIGKNNSGKTSCFTCLRTILLNKPYFEFNDYSISKRIAMYGKIRDYFKGDLQFDELRNQLPPISIQFEVNYSSESEDAPLGYLSPFIIDVDESTVTARIRADYILIADEERFKSFFTDTKDSTTRYINDEDIRDVLNDNFKQMFELKIFAVNPKDESDFQEKSIKELRSLFPLYFIDAERLLGENETSNDTLSKLISNFFTAKETDYSSAISSNIHQLKTIISETTKNFQKHSNELLGKMVDLSVNFGYPNADSLELGVSTKLNIDEQIKNQTALTYKSEENNENLPSDYNGLGYKNLIKIEFELAMYAKTALLNSEACIPLLLIEEPESHMHPQMQAKFVDYINTFVKGLSSSNIQIFLSTHSPHIANTIRFEKIRYAKKTQTGVIYKNLKNFVEKNSDNASFIYKYLTLTKCDLFFADKAILVEGASERIILPDMIRKYGQKDRDSGNSHPLSTQYYTIIEVGGAYAYIFMPFMDFLNIPCLIITDIDSIATDENDNGHAKSVPVSNGTTTSNQTIKWWIRKKHAGRYDSPKSVIPLSVIQSMTKEDKQIEKCRITFQTEENGLTGRSLEESIRNVNRTFYGIPEDTSDDSELKFKVGNKGETKTDFALSLLYEKENYEIPAYIIDGIKWLTSTRIVD